MSHVALTGAGGFLGWHTKIALREQSVDSAVVNVGAEFDIDEAAATLNGSARAIHLAGVNRASDDEVRDGNVLFATQFADALRRTDVPPPIVAYANSTQRTNGSVYGESKLRAAEILREAAVDVGVEFSDITLPNLFGEYGRPFYNAVTATFCHMLSAGEVPTIQQDKELTLLHAQNAADMLIGVGTAEAQLSLEVNETVSGLLARITHVADVYSRGEIPDVSDVFQRDLFNTYRSYTFGSRPAIPLTRHADARGSFFEVIRSHGGPGQSSFSTTVPGVTRGDHFHRRKIERFTVLSGSGVIALRKLFTDRVVEVPVDGEHPVAIDMPTGWAHNITNVGADVLFTSFWTNDIFAPEKPDTIAEVV